MKRSDWLKPKNISKDDVAEAKKSPDYIYYKKNIASTQPNANGDLFTTEAIESLKQQMSAQQEILRREIMMNKMLATTEQEWQRERAIATEMLARKKEELVRRNAQAMRANTYESGF